MKFVTFSDQRGQGIGILRSESEIIDLRGVPGVPSTMIEFIAAGAPALAAGESANRAADDPIRVDAVRLLAPIPRPARNIFCVGKNYSDHISEVHKSGWDKSLKNADAPEYPVIFTKVPQSVIGPGDEIPAHNDPTDSVDYEAEVAVVIGEGGRNIKAADAWKHVYGYTLFNDVSSRVIQRQHGQWFLGKSIDGFGPMGPYLVTADEIADVSALRLMLSINGEVRQDSLLANMIFDIPTIIETISLSMALEPGDVIATGTPSGVGMGFVPPKFLKKGDRVEISAGPLGTLSNTVA